MKVLQRVTNTTIPRIFQHNKDMTAPVYDGGKFLHRPAVQ